MYKYMYLTVIYYKCHLYLSWLLLICLPLLIPKGSGNALCCVIREQKNISPKGTLLTHRRTGTMWPTRPTHLSPTILKFKSHQGELGRLDRCSSVWVSIYDIDLKIHILPYPDYISLLETHTLMCGSDMVCSVGTPCECGETFSRLCCLFFNVCSGVAPPLGILQGSQHGFNNGAWHGEAKEGTTFWVGHQSITSDVAFRFTVVHRCLFSQRRTVSWMITLSGWMVWIMSTEKNFKAAR